MIGVHEKSMHEERYILLMLKRHPGKRVTLGIVQYSRPPKHPFATDKDMEVTTYWAINFTLRYFLSLTR